MSSNFKKGDLVTSVETLWRDKVSPIQAPVGVLIEIAKRPDGANHRILWVDNDGCFEMWHYGNTITHYEGAQDAKEKENS